MKDKMANVLLIVFFASVILCGPLLLAKDQEFLSDSQASMIIGGDHCMCKTTDDCSTACTKVEQGTGKNPVYKYCNGTSTGAWCDTFPDAKYWCEPGNSFNCGYYVTCLLPGCAGQCGEPNEICYFRTPKTDPTPNDCPAT